MLELISKINRRGDYKMEIRIQLKNRVLSIMFGYSTHWSESMYFITICELFFENKEVVGGNMLYKFFKHSKYKDL